MSVQEKANPLDRYRQRASFSVPALRNYLFGEELAKFELQVCETLERDPLFAHQDVDLTLDQKRELMYKRAKRIYEYGFLSEYEDINKLNAFIRALQMYDMSLLGCYNLSASLVANAIRASGTERHSHFVDDLSAMKVEYCCSVLVPGICASSSLFRHRFLAAFVSQSFLTAPTPVP
jgi:hypothetical protein